MRVHLTNLGCKLNQAELERLVGEGPLGAARRLAAGRRRVVGAGLDEGREAGFPPVFGEVFSLRAELG